MKTLIKYEVPGAKLNKPKGDVVEHPISVNAMHVPEYPMVTIGVAAGRIFDKLI